MLGLPLLRDRAADEGLGDTTKTLGRGEESISFEGFMERRHFLFLFVVGMAF